MSIRSSLQLRGIALVGILSILALPACERIPGFQPKDAQPPARYATPAPELSGRAAALSFRDPVFTQLRRRALQGNLDLAEANARMHEAEANVSRYDGRFTGDLDTEVSRSSGAGWVAGLGFDTTLDVFGRRRAAQEAATARYDASYQAALEARRQVLSDLAQAYVELRYQQQLRHHRQQELRGQERILRDLRAQLAEGQSTQIDVKQAEARRAEIEILIPQQDAAIARLKNQISSLLGQPAGGLADQLAFTGAQPQPEPIGALGLPADMIRARPDVEQAERLYAAAIKDIDAAEAARYPQLSLSGSLRAPLSGGSLVDSLAAKLAFPAFSQNDLRADVRGAHARANQAYLQWRSAVLRAVEEVETALVAVQTGRRAVTAAERSVALKADALKLTQDLVKSEGEATELDVLRAESTLTDARITLADRRRDLALNYIALRTALALDEPVRPVYK